MKLLKFLSFIALACALWLPPPAAAVGTWAPVTNAPSQSVGHFMLLTDGTVVGVANPYGYGGPQTWMKLTPDSHGNYAAGTWSNLAATAFGHLDFGSQVLTNGKLFVMGGEYGNCGPTGCELYDPISNLWSQVNVPAALLFTGSSGDAGNSGLRDANSMLLPNGNVLVYPVFPSVINQALIYNTVSNSWSAGPTNLVSQTEGTWVKLPDDSIVTVDPGAALSSERYIPALNKWIADGNVGVKLYDTAQELGPGLLLPNGKAMFFGGTNHTAIYTPSGTTNAGSWVTGPGIPDQQGFPDGPGAMMFNGKTLLVTSHYATNGTEYPSPESFYEYDYATTTYTRILAPSGSNTLNEVLFAALLVDLPDGSVLYGHRGQDFYVYRPDGSPLALAKPAIHSIAVNANGSLHLTGTLFTGLNQGSSYGDDEQMDSNFPLVRFTDASGIVRYGRTYAWSNTGVFKTNLVVSTECAMPPGASLANAVQVVVNGVASDALCIVTNLNDSGPGSLREAVTSASLVPGLSATITFAANLAGKTITLSSQLMVKDTNGVTIDASSLPGGITINGNAASRVFFVSNGASATFNSLTIANGLAPADAFGVSVPGGGGGIFCVGKLVLLNCSVVSNAVAAAVGKSLFAGGIACFGGDVRCTNCTIAANRVTAAGGAGNSSASFYNFLGTLVFDQCTVAGNQSSGATSGGTSDSGFTSLHNTIMANGNTDFRNLSGAVSLGNNLITDGTSSPMTNGVNGDQVGTAGSPLKAVLAALGDYGGPTPTMPPVSGSPAIDAGGSPATVTDQRGFPRVVGLATDIGAVESGTAIPGFVPVVTVNSDVVNPLGVGGVSLRAAVSFATNNSTITFAPGLAGQTITLTNSLLVLDKNLILDGANSGITISGNHTTRIFLIKGQTVSLLGLVLTAGNGYNGGAIQNLGNLTLTRCTLHGNVGGNEGGAIVNYGSPLALTNCTFYNNSASYGGAVSSSGSTMELAYCTLSGNSSMGGGGGAIFNYNSGPLNLNACILAGNTDSSGIGPDLSMQNGTLTAVNCLIGNGTNSTLINGVNGNQVGFTGSPINPLLGALANNGGPTLTLLPQPGSPAIDSGGSTTLTTDQRGFARTVGPAADVGAVETSYGPANVVVTSAADSGAGSLRDALLHNSAGSGITFSNTLSGATITLTSGQLLLNKNVTIDGSALANGITINGNAASRVFYVTSGVSAFFNSLTLSNGVAPDGNFASNGGGGGVFCRGKLGMLNCSVVSNSAVSVATTAYAGAIACDHADVRLTNCTVAFNRVTGGSTQAGAFYNYFGTFILEQSTVASNSAGFANGGVADGGTTSLHATIMANGNTDLDYFSGLTSLGHNLISDGSNSGLTNGVNGDQVGTSGSPLNALLGPLANNGGPTPTMLPQPGSTTIDAGGFTTLATDQRGFTRVVGPSVDIGAVESSYGGNLLVTAVADSGLGSLRAALQQNSGGSLITFSNNLSGGTILLTSGEFLLNKNVTIDGSSLPNGISLNGNNATRIFEIAGGITGFLASLTITNGHDATGEGGGILVDTGGTLTVSNCTLAGNSTTGDGGAIATHGNLTVIQSTLAANFAADYGGGIEAFNFALLVNQSTLTGNTSIATLGGAGIDSFNNDSFTLNNSIVAGNTGPSGDTYGTVLGSHYLTAGNPLLAPLANYGGPALTTPPMPGSPALDAGGSTSLTTDQRGFPRVAGSAPDLGAAEVNSVISSLADNGTNTSLRRVVLGSAPGQVDTFAPGLSGGTITLTNGEIVLNQNLTIDASNSSITISGNNASRIFYVDNGQVVALFNLTLSNGNGSGTDDGYGGAIDNFGNLSLTGCTLTGNTAGNEGGAIENELGSPLALTNCTLTGNSGFFAGAIGNFGGAVNLTYCTISSNACTGGTGGGNDNYNSGSMALHACILAGNADPSGTARDLDQLDGTVTAANCLIGDGSTTTLVNGVNGNEVGTSGSPINPLLGALANNGGPTLTMLPQANSPAINTGGSTTLAFDQRGFARVFGAASDIGSVEAQFVAASSPVLTAVTNLGNGTLRFSFTNFTGASFVVLSTTNLALPLAAWPVLGSALEFPTNSGHFQFTDTPSTNGPLRFYRVRSP